MAKSSARTREDDPVADLRTGVLDRAVDGDTLVNEVSDMYDAISYNR